MIIAIVFCRGRPLQAGPVEIPAQGFSLPLYFDKQGLFFGIVKNDESFSFYDWYEERPIRITLFTWELNSRAD